MFPLVVKPAMVTALGLSLEEVYGLAMSDANMMLETLQDRWREEERASKR